MVMEYSVSLVSTDRLGAGALVRGPGTDSIRGQSSLAPQPATADVYSSRKKLAVGE